MRRKASGHGSRKLFRAVLVSFCLLSVVVSPLAAWPALFGRGESKAVEMEETAVESQSQDPVETVSVDMPQVQPNPSTSSSRPSGLTSEAPSTTSETSSTGSADINELKSEIAALAIKIENAKATEKVEDSLAEDVSAELASISEKLDNALAANAEQADKLVAQSAELEAVKESLKKEQGMKTFAELNFLLGFEDLKPTYGIGGAMGLRIGKGLMVKLGANYMIGTFTALPTFSLDNLQIVAGIGWEW